MRAVWRLACVHALEPIKTESRDDYSVLIILRGVVRINWKLVISNRMLAKEIPFAWFFISLSKELRGNWILLSLSLSFQIQRPVTISQFTWIPLY